MDEKMIAYTLGLKVVYIVLEVPKCVREKVRWSMCLEFIISDYLEIKAQSDNE